MLVTESGMATLVKPLHSRNTKSSMADREAEMVKSTSPLQSAKAASPMLVTESGIFTLVKPLQQSNA